MPGVRLLQRTTDRPLRVHAAIVDLCAAGISARATAPGEGPSTVSAFAERVDADLVVNGDFYQEGFRPIGLAVGDGRRWPGSSDRGSHGLVAFGAGRVWLPPPAEPVRELPDGILEVVGGRPALLRGGEIVAPARGRLCANRHPRTAVGLSEDGRKAVLVVVDGRSTMSAGVTCRELAEILRELGAHDALNLDGGGSSAMWIRGRGVINRPSDGVERLVANHLALRATGDGAAAHCPITAREAVGLADTANTPDTPDTDAARPDEAGRQGP
jgi:exopolysaccharide biosynthesis protein